MRTSLISFRDRITIKFLICHQLKFMSTDVDHACYSFNGEITSKVPLTRDTIGTI